MQELAQQRESLSVALEEANQANKAKTAFLSNMSHEIRTPMNAIIGLDRIALNDPGISDTTREHLEKIGLSAQHLLSIINDILDMSRIESGRMTVKNEEFSFAKALAQVNTIISGKCSDKGIEYECRVKGAVDDYYIGDDMKLRQVLINILGNAVKFTPSGGIVTFGVETVARFNGRSTLRFIISDTGIGMSQDFIPRLFDAFSQEDSSSTNRFGSTGLGMAITRSIIELMNGTISVESEKQKIGMKSWMKRRPRAWIHLLRNRSSPEQCLMNSGRLSKRRMRSLYGKQRISNAGEYCWRKMSQ